jgi:outer membrane lipoprotein carrier protein
MTTPTLRPCLGTVMNMLMKSTVVLLPLLLLLNGMSPVFAQPATTVVTAPVVAAAESWELQQLVSLLQATNSLRAEVDQLLIDQDGRELQETRAVLSMQKPSNFRWEITQPYTELMVTDGKTVWRYEPDLEQVSIQEFDGDLDRTPIMLLNGSADDIKATFTVIAANIDNGKQMRFVLEPKQPDSLFERMSLTFTGEELSEMQFEDSLGQKTSLSFHNIQRNLPLGADQFRFTPPQGVDLIDSRE